MTPSSKRVLGVAGLLAVILVMVVLLHLPGPSDQDQILAQLASARAAAERHDVGGIMQIVSANYQGSTPYDSNVDELHFFLIHLVGHDNAPVRVLLSPPTVQIQGDTAVSTGQVTVRSSEAGEPVYNEPVTLHWKKEAGTKWLVFPAKVWRVNRADFTPPDVGGGLF